ncbi:MAG TPA: Holliday junction resolvase RuvX [Dehalococcoidia bacterium]|nr:Holliday junction resolvase RuvX [Dehalococcoidia bacterium]
MPRLLGVDAGEERIGLAVGDEGGLIAVPLAIIERRGRALDRVAEEIAARAHAEAAETIIVGLPLNIDGTEGRQAKRARGLGRRIAAASGLPLAYWDERMSSFIAESRLAEARAASVRRGRRHVDDLAAAVILQSYLDARRGGGA